MKAEEEPKSDWARHAYRVLNVIDNQVRSLRSQQVIDSYKVRESDSAHRYGAYWGIRTNIANYQLPDALPCPFERTMDLAETPTRLKRLDENRQQRLINWGYAVCDAALRKHFDPPPAAPTDFPYPAAGV
jgi:NTE family protein